jgi:hypothetical protein
MHLPRRHRQVLVTSCALSPQATHPALTYIPSPPRRSDQTALAINASTPQLPSAHNGWAYAYVSASILFAADWSKEKSRAVQQLAVSFAAHDSLTAIFLAQYPAFDAAMKEIENTIAAAEKEALVGREIGQDAARKVAKARYDDNITMVNGLGSSFWMY